MPEFIRVKDKQTGHEVSVPVALYDANADAFTKVDKPATDSAGTPLPAKHKTTVSSEAAKRTKSGQTADSTKETS